MRRVLSLGLILGGGVLIALSFSGIFTPDIPCNDTPSVPGTCLAPFPWGSHIALWSGVGMVIVGLLSYPGDRGRREGASAGIR